ncbi:phage tail protein [Paraburkholderia sp. BR10936]|uniref:phage tail-collar fiber domain-containing protein n=1 Tax=Paraburkholderia sp. BR10936 TaxID=3236993 RepID=UPI0034D23261
MATYRTIHTNYGLRRMAQAEATGIPINLVAVAVGDGGGNATTPDESQTKLVREVYRAAPNRVYQDPLDQLKWTVEVIIPASEGGFVMREAAVFDDTGAMFLVANTPDSYKPIGDGSEGSFSDTVLRLQFAAFNASIITLQIDANTAVATQDWIANTITLPYLLKGGSRGQILAKLSNADGDVVWQDPTTANVTVNTIDEVQTLAEGQSEITLEKCTTIGLAVYVGGSRLLPSEWTPDDSDHAKLSLVTPADSEKPIYFVQNDPAGYIPDPLIQHNNLSDLLDVAAARSNLGVDSKSNTDTHAPPGNVAYTAASAAPTGWLKANGALVSRTTYAALFAAIGTTYGVGDGVSTFSLPDLRGEFLRGFDDSRGVDTNRKLGSSQSESFLSHNHAGSTDSQGSHNHVATIDQQGAHAHGGSTSAVGDHQHVSPFGENSGSYAPPWGTYGANNQVGSKDHDNDNMWGMTSPAGGHSHTIGTDTQGTHAHNATIQNNGAHVHNITINAAGGTETRPRNVALLAIIKY